MSHKHLCKHYMDQAINQLNDAKELLLIQDYEQAENKLADTLDYIANALGCIEHE